MSCKSNLENRRFARLYENREAGKESEHKIQQLNNTIHLVKITAKMITITMTTPAIQSILREDNTSPAMSLATEAANSLSDGGWYSSSSPVVCAAWRASTAWLIESNHCLSRLLLTDSIIRWPTLANRPPTCRSPWYCKRVLSVSCAIN